MTTPLLEQLDRIAGTGDDIFETRDEDARANTEGASDVTGSKYRRPIDAPDRTSPIPDGGPLLEEESPAKLFKTIEKEVERQERLAKNRDEEGKHWDRVKRGVQFSELVKSEDQSVYRAVLPNGVEDVQQPIPNKVLDLCGKQVSQILVDPPLPAPKVDGDSAQNRGAVDVAKRFLRADGDVSGTNDMEVFRKALTINRTRKSTFAYLWVDPTAGGWRPKQIMAHPLAEDPSNPMMGPSIGPNGQPALDANQQPMLERTTDPKLRYVGEVDDEQAATVGIAAKREVFVDHPAEAAREWLPKHRVKVLPPNQVRTLPPTATVAEAHSIILLMWAPLSEARRMFPDVIGPMTDEELKALCTWRPKRWKAIVPEAQRPKSGGNDEERGVGDDSLVFWYHKFCRINEDYPDGAEIAVNGAQLHGSETQKGLVLCRDTLREDVETEDGTLVPVLMDPPIAQFRALIDSAEQGDPFGGTPVEAFGGANEIRAHLYLSVLEDIDVRLRMNTFLTATSSITKQDMNRRDGTPLEVLTKDDMPTFEQRPPLPPHTIPTLERVDGEMNVAANLNETAQALDSSYSASGEAKKVALRQAKVQLAQEYQGFINGVQQYWRVKLQLAQARLKQPQLLKAATGDTAFKVRYFVGADLIGVTTVALQPGTGTMMSAAEKAQFLATLQGQKWLDENEAGELARSSMSDDLGLEPSPHEECIDRQIAEWLEGPPDGWEAANHAFQAFPQQQQAYSASLQQKVAEIVSTGRFDQLQAQKLAMGQLGPEPVQPPEPFNPFAPRANDEEPIVAKIRYQRLSRLISGPEYSAQPKFWRALVDAAYTTARFAAGIVTMREQQEAQAKQAAAGQHADDKNAPPSWAEFVAKTQQQVVSMAATEVAKAVAGADGIGAKPEPTPEGSSSPDATVLQLHHEARENERDRAHELRMAQVGHANAMTQASAKTQAALVGKSLDHAARAAERAQGQPLPERPS